MYYEILAKIRVNDELREAEKRRLINLAKKAQNRKKRLSRHRLQCQFGLIPVCQHQMSV